MWRTMKKNLTPRQKQLVRSHLATGIRREECRLLVGLDVPDDKRDAVNLYLWKLAEQIEKTTK